MVGHAARARYRARSIAPLPSPPLFRWPLDATVKVEKQSARQDDGSRFYFSGWNSRVPGGIADHHVGIFLPDAQGVMKNAGGNGEGVAGIENDFLASHRVLQPPFQQVEKLLAVPVGVPGIGMPLFYDDPADGHVFQIADLGASQPSQRAPILLDPFSFGILCRKEFEFHSRFPFLDFSAFTPP